MALTKITGQVINTATDVTVGVLTVTDTLAVGGTVSVGGTLTYEDVTNVDSVGLITARNGIVVGSGITLSKDGDAFFTGVTTATKFVGANAEVSGDLSGATGTFTGNVSIADKIIHTGDTDTAIRFPSADTVSVETGGTEALRVDSSQRLVLGATSQRTVWGGQQKLSIEGLDGATSSLSIVRNSNDAFYPFIALGKSRGTSDGSSTVIQENDVTGIISFNAADGTDMTSQTAYIESAVDDSPGSNDTPGRLSFYTTADGSASSTERLRITSAGKIGIGLASPKTDLDIANDAGGTLTLSCSDDSSSADQLIGKINFHTADPSGDGPQNNAIISAHSVESTGSGAYLKFSTATGATGSEGADAVERLRIASDGKLFTTRTHASSNTGNHPAVDIDTYSNNGSPQAAMATGIDFNVEGVHKKRLAVTYADSSAGTGDWIFYRDNGNNIGMKISAAGYITAPQQPYVMLGLTANQAVGQSSTKEVIFDSVMYDTASGYNSSNGRYTCPVVGDYLVTFDCQYTGMVNAFHLGVGVNGTNPPGGTNFDLWNHTGDSVRGDNIARVLRITATTQYISFFTYTTSGGDLEPNRTKATIKFLG